MEADTLWLSPAARIDRPSIQTTKRTGASRLSGCPRLDFFYDSMTRRGKKKKKKSNVFQICCHTESLFFYWDSDSQILIKCRSLRGIITSTYALTPSLNTYLDYHLTFYGFLSSSCLPSCLSDRLLPSPHAACSGPETNSKTTEWATGEMEDGTEQRERERHGKRVCVKNHILSAECHLEVER